jgi:polysaccharide chain length determinant protein (PEP-CTERM system associated)
MNISFDELSRVFRDEVLRHRNAVVLMFIAISLSVVFLGMIWPQNYKAASLILVDQKKTIQPLTEGVAVPTEVKEFAQIARELIKGHKIMNAILKKEGWLKDKPSPAEQERIMEGLRGRTQISSVGSNLIMIEYRDKEAVQAANIANHLAELLLAASIEKKTQESGTAFEFLDKQVREYHKKLLEAENKLKEFRSKNIDAQPGTEAGIATRITEIRRSLEQTQLELAEALSKKGSIESQLAGEAGVTVSLTREAQYQAQLAQMQTELDKLRLSYHDTHPKVIRVKHQMRDLAEAIANEKQPQEARVTANDNKQPFADKGVFINPLHEELRREMSATKTTIDTLRVRIAQTEQRLKYELERGKRIHVGELMLAELTRDYEVNRDIYQQLLKRRENARVSMSLDQAEQGMNLRIQERAVVPVQPSGPRFLHFVAISLALGIGIPLGLIGAGIQFDPRVRFKSTISDKLSLPVLAVIPHLSTLREARWKAWDGRLLGLLVLLYLGIFTYIVWLKFTGGLTVEVGDALKFIDI